MKYLLIISTYLCMGVVGGGGWGYSLPWVLVGFFDRGFAALLRKKNPLPPRVAIPCQTRDFHDLSTFDKLGFVTILYTSTHGEL